MKWIRSVFLLFVLLTVSVLGASGQVKHFYNLVDIDYTKLRLGFYFGLNVMDAVIVQYSDYMDNPVLQDPANATVAEKTSSLYGDRSVQVDINPLSPGFTVGIASNYLLNRTFDLRVMPGISIGSRRFLYSTPISSEILSNIGATGVSEASYLTVPSAYVDVPVGIRYNAARHVNTKPYIYLGCTYRYDLESRRNRDKVIRMLGHGVYADIAIGLNHYLPFFKLTPEFRASFGLINMIDHSIGDKSYDVPYYGFTVEKFYPNVFMLVLYFE